ncbi:hypothetical protein D3C71_1751980 [compost metagenome]
MASATRPRKLPSSTPSQFHSMAPANSAGGGLTLPVTALRPTSSRALTMAKVKRFCRRANTSVPRMFSTASTPRMPSGTTISGTSPGNSWPITASTSSSSADRPNIATTT